MDRQRHNLIAHLLGDLSADEAKELEVRLANDPVLRAEHESLTRQIEVLRAIPANDAPDALVNRVLAAAREAPRPVARVLRPTFISWLPRVAAALVFAGLVALAITALPEGPSPVIATVSEAGYPKRHVTDGELVEVRIGSPARVEFTAGELLVDGGGAIRLYATGKHTPPVVEVDRGRVVLEASGAVLKARVAGREVEIDQGSVLAIEYDRRHARILDGGAIVEIQRTPLSDALELAKGAYRLDLDGSGLPPAVRRQRVTFSGTGLSAEAFTDRLLEAASEFGVVVDETGRHLKYEPTSHLVDDIAEDDLLRVAVISGRAHLTAPEATESLGGPGESAMVAFAFGGKAWRHEGPRRGTSWALGLGNATVDNLLQGARAEGATLPAGTVIYPNRLVLPAGPERIFVLDGPDFNFPLPGGRKGRLVALLSSGAEFEVEGGVIRVFVPFSQASSKD